MSYEYTHQIHLDKSQVGHAYYSGTIDHLSFYAIMHKETIPKGLNFRTLEMGEGHVERLLIYTEDTDFEGNPYTPSMTIKRNVYAEFHEGWLIYNPNYESYVSELVRYLEVRLTFHMV